MSRTSTVMRTRLGMLLTAPGKTSQMPTVATVSIARWTSRAASTASAISAAARKRRGDRGISTAPAWPPSPSISICKLAGAAMAVTTPSGMSGAFEQRTLLDVQFDEGVIRSRAAARPLASGPEKPAAGADLIERRALGVAQRCRRVRVERAGQQAAAEAADAEARRLLRSEQDQFDGSPRTKAGALQRADRFQSAEHADRAVVPRRSAEWRRCASRWRRPAARARRPSSARRCCPTRPRGPSSPASAHSCLSHARACRSDWREDDARDRGRGRDRRRTPAFPVPAMMRSDCDRGDSCVHQRVAIPILVDEILRGHLAERAEPLRAVGSHPDEVAGGDRDTSSRPAGRCRRLRASAGRAP